MTIAKVCCKSKHTFMSVIHTFGGLTMFILQATSQVSRKNVLPVTPTSLCHILVSRKNVLPVTPTSLCHILSWVFGKVFMSITDRGKKPLDVHFSSIRYLNKNPIVEWNLNFYETWLVSDRYDKSFMIVIYNRNDKFYDHNLRL